MTNEVTKEEKIGTNLIETVIKLPYVKVDRNTFLTSYLTKNLTDEEKIKLITEGPTSIFNKRELDSFANKRINEISLKSAGTSALTGLPGGLALAASIPADLVQFFAFSCKLAQEIAYIYGYDDLWEDGKLTEESRNKIIIFLGTMFGVNAAGSLLRISSKPLSANVAKKIAAQPLTKTAWYPIIKKVLKLFGVKVTKNTVGSAAGKIIPILGGVISGGLTYTSMKPMGKRLSQEFSKGLVYTEEDMQKDIEIIEATAKEV